MLQFQGVFLNSDPQVTLRGQKWLLPMSRRPGFPQEAGRVASPFRRLLRSACTSVPAVSSALVSHRFMDITPLRCDHSHHRNCPQDPAPGPSGAPAGCRAVRTGGAGGVTCQVRHSVTLTCALRRGRPAWPCGSPLRHGAMLTRRPYPRRPSSAPALLRRLASQPPP